jgi:hypothetical protein
MADPIPSRFLPLWADLKHEDQFHVRKPLLAHYSSMEVLEKIIRTDEIWLSNPLFMNDIEEVRFGLNESHRLVLESKEIAQVCGDSVRVDTFRNSFTHFYSQFASTHVLDTYVLCLSEHKPADVDGVLSMWRGYGGNGDGAAIVLDASKLNNLPTSKFILSKVHYGSGPDRIRWIKNKIDLFVSLFSSEPVETSNLPAVAFQLFQRFKLFALFSKHIGFSEEAEWRVVYLRDRDAEGLIVPMFDYRVGSRGIEPILKFKIEAKPGITAPDFSLEKLVDRIILGPTVSSPLALAAVVKMIEKIGRPDLARRVRASAIPYRSRKLD